MAGIRFGMEHGRMLRGALADDVRALWRNRRLLAMMTRREVSSRFAGSVLGAAWLYAQPLLLIAVYYLLFDVVFKARVGVGADARSAGAHLIAGMIAWMAFSDAVSASMRSIVQEGHLLQKNPLPPVLFPARVVAASGLTYLPLMALVAFGYAVTRGGAGALFALPVLIAGLFALAFLCGYALALMAAAVRDVQQVASLLLSLGMFASPVLFSLEMFPEGLRWLLWLNPMTPVVLGFQEVLLANAWPAPIVWQAMLLWVLGLSVLVDHMAANTRDQLVDWL